MYSQFDEEVNQYLLFGSILYHRKDVNFLSVADQYVVVRGKISKRKTMKGWNLSVQWKEGTTTWESLSDLKESHPIQVSEYLLEQGISHEPAFNWWVTNVLKKQEAIISALNGTASRVIIKNIKFGIKVPQRVNEALRLDENNGNYLWIYGIEKEINSVTIAFKLLDEGKKPPPTYQAIIFHMIFDIKMEYFRQKDQYVAGGHVTVALPKLTYASVVSRESVRIALTFLVFNNLEVKTSEIQNAYLTAHFS